MEAVAEHAKATQMAHTCPKKEQPRFIQNQMGLYLTQPINRSIDAPSNLIPLRADIHWLWNQLELCFVLQVLCSSCPRLNGKSGAKAIVS